MKTLNHLDKQMHISLNTAIDSLNNSETPFKELFNHGSLSIEIYKPIKVDLQQPHSKDEVYIIINGSGTFINGEKEINFKSGDFLFVPAGVEHRFINFTDDFSTWVIFYGPIGGEKKI